MQSPAPGLAAALLAAAIVAPSSAAASDAAAAVVTPAPAPSTADDSHLTGRDIYDRVTENRFQSVIQESTLRSTDRGGREQMTKLHMKWRDFRAEDGNALRGILSKTLVKYTHPFDIRHSGYLVIHNDNQRNDQFMYLSLIHI